MHDDSRRSQLFSSCCASSTDLPSVLRFCPFNVCEGETLCRSEGWLHVRELTGSGYGVGTRHQDGGVGGSRKGTVWYGFVESKKPRYNKKEGIGYGVKVVSAESSVLQCLQYLTQLTSLSG